MIQTQLAPRPVMNAAGGITVIPFYVIPLAAARRPPSRQCGDCERECEPGLVVGTWLIGSPSYVYNVCVGGWGRGVMSTKIITRKERGRGRLTTMYPYTPMILGLLDDILGLRLALVLEKARRCWSLGWSMAVAVAVLAYVCMYVCMYMYVRVCWSVADSSIGVAWWGGGGVSKDGITLQ
ncbi:hypothetical protein DFP73DRAFT_9053 [Morchella snyderi]|nr:hypothetical protein DFP73DRAFT_9053 [Morchella snyderi]